MRNKLLLITYLDQCLSKASESISVEVWKALHLHLDGVKWLTHKHSRCATFGKKYFNLKIKTTVAFLILLDNNFSHKIESGQIREYIQVTII